VEDILQTTAVFSSDEVNVALELFDETYGAAAASAGALSSDSAAGNDYTFVGAFTPDDELAGYACYGPTPGTDRTFDLYWIAVDPRRHGTGSGTAILTEVERSLEAQRARVLIVETSSRSDYAPTRRFYERRGYEVAARLRDFYAPGDDRVIFSKRFPQGVAVP